MDENLVGIYLTGSLSYGAFKYESSDIDLMVIVRRTVSRGELEAIRKLHGRMEAGFTKWARRLECTYTPVSMLTSVMPPREPRPWYWGGAGLLYEEAQYGNEWIINNYLLYQHGVTLYGPDFKALMGPVDIAEVQKACIRDLFREWEPKANDPEWFQNSHYAAYFILNLCRILYTVMRKDAGSKPTAAAWARSQYGGRWNALILTAEDWHYGVELDLRKQAVEFLYFVIDEVSKTPLYGTLSEEIRKLRE